MGNPMLQRIGLNNAASAGFMDLLAGIKAGTVDPQAEVERRMASMSPGQKNRLRMAMPLLKAFAQRYGVSAGDIDKVVSVLQNR